MALPSGLSVLSYHSATRALEDLTPPHYFLLQCCLLSRLALTNKTSIPSRNYRPFFTTIVYHSKLQKMPDVEMAYRNTLFKPKAWVEVCFCSSPASLRITLNWKWQRNILLSTSCRLVRRAITAMCTIRHDCSLHSSHPAPFYSLHCLINTAFEITRNEKQLCKYYKNIPLKPFSVLYWPYSHPRSELIHIATYTYCI